MQTKLLLQTTHGRHLHIVLLEDEFTHYKTQQDNIQKETEVLRKSEADELHERINALLEQLHDPSRDAQVRTLKKNDVINTQRVRSVIRVVKNA
jgi:hypothetical protein